MRESLLLALPEQWEKSNEKGTMTLMKSMTGYGRAVETAMGREFTV